LIQQNKVIELIDEYVRENINSIEDVGDHLLYRHLQNIVQVLIHYNIHPRLQKEAPYQFFATLHRFNYINVSELTQMKQRFSTSMNNTMELIKRI
jgi:hypothetical protein